MERLRESVGETQILFCVTGRNVNVLWNTASYIIFRTLSLLRALSTKKKDTCATHGAHNEYFDLVIKTSPLLRLVFDNIYLFIQEIHRDKASNFNLRFYGNV